MKVTSVIHRRTNLDLWRRSSDRIVAGVAGGLADRLGVPAGYVRAGFMLAALLWGLGLVVYVVLWMVTFEVVEDRPAKITRPQQRVGLACMFAGSLLFFRGIGWWPSDVVMVMAAALAFGLAILGDYDWVSRIFDPQGAKPSKRRVGGGAILLVAGLAIFANSVSQVRTLGAVATAVIVTVVGIGLVFGPWLVTLGRELGSERRERIRQEERAEMAAHLHDSVLQTLALMQRTNDPKRMTTLARQQERELRSWLYGSRPSAGEMKLTEAIEAVGARVEADFTLPVEVVTVGDAVQGETTRALIAAAGEAMVNAAKHSQAPEVSVYAEVADGRADVWVADLGVGFDPAAVPSDRRGLVDSIQGRLRRVGGGAAVDTRIGEGTEVHLWAPVEADPRGSR